MLSETFSLSILDNFNESPTFLGIAHCLPGFFVEHGRLPAFRCSWVLCVVPEKDGGYF